MARRAPGLNSAGSKLLDALVIKAVLEGAETPEEVERALGRLNPAEVRRAIERLLAEGSLAWRTKKRFLLGEKKVLAVTEKGLRKLEEAREEARRIAEAYRGPGTLETGEAAAVDPLVLMMAFMLLGLPLAWLPMVSDGFAGEDMGEEVYEYEDVDADLDIDL